ncbi:hypothetical protein Aduo_000882 [Ancylostoma duodenale]
MRISDGRVNIFQETSPTPQPRTETPASEIADTGTAIGTGALEAAAFESAAISRQKSENGQILSKKCK